MVLGPQCVNLSVANLDRAIAWYCGLLDGEVVFRQRYDEMELQIAFVRVGDFEVELIQFDGSRAGAQFPDPPRHAELRGVTHFAFHVADLEAMSERLAARDIPILFGPRVMANGTMKVIFVRDLDDNLVKFVQRMSVDN